MIVCHSHALPFADESFDGVVIQAVLEHVLDPPAVVAEIHRVLKPTGVVHAKTPFMQQVHEGPYDFTRWTETGHRRLFRMFEAIETGVTAGPAATLLWSITYFARAIPRRPALQLALSKLAGRCFIWLKPLDAWLLSRLEQPAALRACISWAGERRSRLATLMCLLGTVAPLECRSGGGERAEF